MGDSRVAHDHVVLLLDQPEFEHPPTWLTNNFYIIEGGTHAGGSSRNKLIIFKDGTYLELFTWIDKPKEFLAWSNKPPGLIDFALTTLPPVTAEGNQERLHRQLQDSDLGISYSKPQAGGRKRIDGVEVRWKTTRPVFSSYKKSPNDSYLHDDRLDVPFFCHDVTDRAVRVPYDDDAVTTHPCGAIGISNIQIVVPESHYSSYVALGRSLLGTEEESRSDGENGRHFRFKIMTPISAGSNSVSTVSFHSPANTGHGTSNDDPNISPEDQRYEQWLTGRGIGICGLVLNVKGEEGSGHEPRQLDHDGIGATIYLEPVSL